MRRANFGQEGWDLLFGLLGIFACWKIGLGGLGGERKTMELVGGFLGFVDIVGIGIICFSG